MKHLTVPLIVTALLVSLGLPHLTSGGPPLASAAPLNPRVMPLGDSLTDGFNVPGGYRVGLWQRLAATGCSVDFVGSQTNGPAGLGDKNHEGHPGWVIETIDANVAAWLNAHQPEIILLMIGTNDINGNLNVGQAPARLSTLIDKILAQAPASRLIVASIPPMAPSPGDPNRDQRVIAYNAAIPGIVNARVAAGKQVSYIDMYGALTVADLADGIHPNAGGYEKMAGVWWSTLVSYLSLGNPASTWYFAEGYTGAGFDEYLTILNPNDVAVPVNITYFLANGATQARSLTVAGNGRATIAVHDHAQGVGRGQEVAARVASANGAGIVVERPMYFTYGNGVTGGHTVIGANTPQMNWYFAEGYTGTGFDQYLTILNPNPTAANVAITYFLNGGAPTTKQFAVAGNARRTVAVHDPALGVGRGKEVSARVTTTNAGGIVVERPIYFTYGAGVTGGHDVLGASGPRLAWYFAEGYTGAGFDEYLTILNPNLTAAGVTITYFLAGGAPVAKVLNVAANSRATVAVHDPTLGVGRGQTVAALVTTSNAGGIVVERPVYFTYTGSMGAVTGGHDVMGAAGPRATWYFAEGYTGAGFDEYLTILNPNATPLTLTLTFFRQGTAPLIRSRVVAANARATVVVHDEVEGVGRNGGGGWQVATKVESPSPIVVERPIYFRYGVATDGGHNVMGYAP